MDQDALHQRLEIAVGNLVSFLRTEPPMVLVSEQAALLVELRRRVVVRAAVRGQLDEDLLATWEIVDALARCTRLAIELHRYHPNAAESAELADRFEALTPSTATQRSPTAPRPSRADAATCGAVRDGLATAVLHDLDRETARLESLLARRQADER